LAATEFPELDQIVEGLIVPGMSLLQGKPKVGKSLLVMEMVLSACMGRPAMMHFRCKQVPAVAFMMEDPYRRLKDRQRAICDGKGPPDNLYWFDVTMRKHFNGDALGFIDSVVDDTGTRIVVLDTFEKIRRHLKLPKETGRIYGDDYAAAALLQEWAQGRNVALIVLHHDRKADGDLIDRVSGTLGIAGAADQIIGMTSKAEGAHKRWFIETRGRDLEPREFEIALSGSRWMFIGEKDDDIVDPLEAEVREMIAAGKSQREIAKVTGLPRSTIQGWLKR
jgi:RecA-family ATPase